MTNSKQSDKQNPVMPLKLSEKLQPNLFLVFLNIRSF